MLLSLLVCILWWGVVLTFFIDCECCDDMFGFRVSGCDDCDECERCVVVSNE